MKGNMMEIKLINFFKYNYKKVFLGKFNLLKVIVHWLNLLMANNS